ncbi:YncE family protein [Solibacillus silvestris]|uniref:YncE family protein n=1 Tax=Solibacillus silvestris TaxID=76853 RepID=UPI003F819F21
MQEINPHQPFVASVNIIQPSITFYDNSGELIATWPFEKGYTGAALIGFDHVVLYGYQLEKADIVQLSSGKFVRSIDVGAGVTNAYYDEMTSRLFMTNGKTNELASYTDKGILANKVKLRNYPMSMVSAHDCLYVVNYKDTVLSVVHKESLNVVDEWSILSSSQGLFIAEERQELWVGGHGKGNKPNEFVQVYNMATGQLKNKILLPLMPIAFSQAEGDVVISSHGSNMIYRVTLDGDVLWKREIGANPFAVTQFQDKTVVAGYDDHTLYFLADGEVRKQVQTYKGPFQLLVRGDRH